MAVNPRSFGWGLAGGLIVALGLLLVANNPADPPPASGELGGNANVPELPTPCGGEESTSSLALESVPFDYQIPQTELTADVTGVWLCSDDQILTLYRSGVAVMLGRNDLADPEGEWKSLAAQEPGFSVGEIDGIGASLADPAKGTLGQVDMVVGDVRVTVTGNGEIPLDELELLAAAVQVGPEEK
jgi:hypothetical protein